MGFELAVFDQVAGQPFISQLTEQDASNKSSLLLKIQNQNTKTLQLFTINIEMQNIYKSC
jgi:hypothetical protein